MRAALRLLQLSQVHVLAELLNDLVFLETVHPQSNADHAHADQEAMDQQQTLLNFEVVRLQVTEQRISLEQLQVRLGVVEAELTGVDRK